MWNAFPFLKSPFASVGCAAALAFLVAIAGCVEPMGGVSAGPDQSAARRLPGYSTDPVARVVPFFLEPPACLRNLDPQGDPNPEGFACTLYLASARTNKGIHPEGMVQAKMYRLEPTAQGIVNRRLVYESEAVPAYTLRYSTKPTAMGWGYAPTFYWGDADVLGCWVEVIIEFTGVDGRVVRSQARRIKVPARKS